ncbi:calcyclin binding protein-like [Theileria orientalis strain Shintoku]|uniref:Calcyclin binding protein-like n=1 Tax=Theileria orientalis strain Shintoku TaxID=869250 RepID=J4D8U9_THEOR|nr:calcyclin binding protein-like [Theileria orientalis strain Shintoku]PVC50642.1 calcyclin binding protein-like [Theileria orientalis]BAM41020.1 calcyclin binding protein-like [Theileria orientalis strain Shintoku]|eukprot:XP_009691321.1 calcyclin binding protein-like [Theileria orientalis strain Shintoku]
MSLADLEEWQRLLSLATRPSVKTQIQLFISNLESTVVASNGVNSKANVVYNTISSFSWDQTPNFVTVLIPFAEELKDVVVDVDTESLDVKFCSGSKHYQFKVKKLYSTVKKEGVSWKQKSGYLQVKLEKDKQVNWASLSSASDKDKKPILPKSDDSNPQAMLMDMMKNLYNEGDDEMKRTIAKAWVRAYELIYYIRLRLWTRGLILWFKGFDEFLRHFLHPFIICTP